MNKPNTGAGTEVERVRAALWHMVHSTNPVTRYVCRDIIAQRIAQSRSGSQE
jgi:hypothetical protein